VEKFHVYNKDKLGDALRDRLHELEIKSNKWTPEVLQLLLELSDRPAMKSKLEDLDFLQPPEEHVEPHYTWEELAAEDPLLRDKHIWQNIDYGVESSDDEVLSQDSIDDSDLTAKSATSSVEDEDFLQVEDFIVPVDSQLLRNIEQDQFWRAGEDVCNYSLLSRYFSRSPFVIDRRMYYFDILPDY
jgi:gamma-tubulin complex component 5